MQQACTLSLKATGLAAAPEHDHHNTHNSHFVCKQVHLHLDAAFTGMRQCSTSASTWQKAHVPLQPLVYTNDHRLTLIFSIQVCKLPFL